MFQTTGGKSMKKRQAISIPAIITGLGVLSGCFGNTTSKPDYIDADDLAEFSKPNIPPIVFGSSENAQTENSADKSGNFSDLDTEFEVPASGDYYTATTEIMEYDAQKVKNVIFGNTAVTDNTMTYPDREPVYVWNYEDKELYVSNDNACIDFTSSLSTSIGIIFRLPSQGDSGNVNKFSHTDDDLDFCTRNEAVKSVCDVLSQLGISVSDKVDIYALHQDDIQSVVDEECEKGEFYQFDSEWQRIPVDSYTVQKNQECYYMVFKAEWNGVPIYNDTLYYMTIKDLAIFHPTITAVYSADGLSELRISEYRSVVDKGEKITQIISPESAAQAAAKKYKDVAGMEEISFDKMSLMYVLTPFSENGKIVSYKTNMTPAWVCTVKMTEYTYDRETGTQAPVTSFKNILIDARTGMEII